MSNRDLRILILLTLLAIAFALPLLLQPGALIFPASNLGSDIALRHWPDFDLYARMLRQGVVPLWDGSILLGRPLAGDTDSLWMYPPALIVLAAPLALAFNLLAFFHMLLAGALAYAYLANGLGLSRLGALTGAVVFMFWPKFVAHVAAGHVGLTGAAALVPLALLGAHLSFYRSKILRGGAMMALALTGQLVAHAQIFIYTVLLVTAYALIAALPLMRQMAQRSWWLMLRPLVALAVAGLLTIGVSAAALFPALELLPFVSRQQFALADAARYSLPPMLAINLVLPVARQFPEWLVYPGALPLTLSLIALTGRKRVPALVALGLASLAWVYSLGPATPLFSLAFLIPGLNLLRVAPRLWLLAGIPLAVAAGWGAETLVESRPAWQKSRRNILLALSALLAIGVLSALTLPLVDALLAGTEFVALLLLMILMTLRDRGRLDEHGFGRALAGAMGLAMLVIGWRFLAWVRPEETFLKDFAPFNAQNTRLGTERWYAETDHFPYALAASKNIEVVQAVQSFQLAHPVELISLAAGCNVSGYAAGVPACLTPESAAPAGRRTDPSARLMGLLNVRWLLRPEPPTDAGWQPVAGYNGLYENKAFLPRAFVVGEVRQVPPDEVLDQLRVIDPARTALLSDPLPITLDDPDTSGPADAFYHNPQSIEITVNRQSPGLLVISQSWTPGWQARLDGSSVPVYRVDHALLGVYLPEGSHKVSLNYNPRGWQWGRPLSVLTLLGAMAADFLLRRRRA